MKLNRIIQGDALEILSLLPNDTFAGIVTSPPYNLGDRNPPSKSQRQDPPDKSTGGVGLAVLSPPVGGFPRWQRTRS